MFKRKEAISWTEFQNTFNLQSIDDWLTSVTSSSKSEDNEDISQSSKKSFERHRKMHRFGQALDDEIILVKCNFCSKPILASEFSVHWNQCKSNKSKSSRRKSSTSISRMDASGLEDEDSGDENLDSVSLEKNIENLDDDDETVIKRHHSSSSGKSQAKKEPPSSLLIISNEDDADSDGNKSPTTLETPSSIKDSLSTPANESKSSKKKKRKPESLNDDVNDTSTVASIEKKTKREPSTTTKLDKTIVDLDRQCGVLLDTGLLCPRSITCKIHPVHAKRAVIGRSQLYDQLVQQHQSKNARKDKKKPSTESTVKPTGSSMSTVDNLITNSKSSIGGQQHPTVNSSAPTGVQLTSFNQAMFTIHFIHPNYLSQCRPFTHIHSLMVPNTQNTNLQNQSHPSAALTTPMPPNANPLMTPAELEAFQIMQTVKQFQPSPFVHLDQLNHWSVSGWYRWRERTALLESIPNTLT